MNLSASVLSLSVLGPKDLYPLCSVLSCPVWVLGRVFGWAVCACVPACHGLTHSPNQDSQHHGKGNFYLVKRVCELWALGQNTLLPCLSTLRWYLTCRVLCLYLGKAQDHPPKPQQWIRTQQTRRLHGRHLNLDSWLRCWVHQHWKLCSNLCFQFRSVLWIKVRGTLGNYKFILS